MYSMAGQIINRGERLGWFVYISDAELMVNVNIKTILSKEPRKMLKFG